MHVIITDARLARSRAIHLSGLQLAMAGLLAAFILMIVAAAMYHWIFLRAAREGWPVIAPLAQQVGGSDSEEQQRFMRANLDAMARKVGEMQARVMQLESLGDRVMGLAGMPPVSAAKPPGQGGALVSGRPLGMAELQKTLDDLAKLTDQRVDLMTVVESRLFDQQVSKRMIPTQAPVPDRPTGSPFGWRIDPLTGQSALHTGLDFPADTGTPILAAAGGVVVTQEYHPAYGNMIEVDHGNHLVTRYAHASRVWVKRGDLVKRGQKIASVGTSGRSTGPHLHFEVLVQGVPQDPQKFLVAGGPAPGVALASAQAGGGTAGRPAAGR